MSLLAAINDEYEKIMDSISPDKNQKLEALMMKMESLFSIPEPQTKEYKKENKKVLSLYRKISMSRDL